jgi:hypothetical protein
MERQVMRVARRSEPEVIRPFVGIESAELPLAKVQLLVNGDPHAPGPVAFDDDDALANAKFVLRLPEPSEVRAAVEATGVPVVDCGFVVILTGRSHRVSKVLLQEPLRTAHYDTEVELDRSDHDLILNDRSGFTITAAIALLTANAAAPLRPHMPGTWLARRDFSVSASRDNLNFSPEALTDQIREHLNLPKGTLRHIEVDDVLDSENVGDSVHVYVDEQVLNLLLANPTDLIAVQMQIDLAVTATTDIATTIARELAVQGHVDPTNLDGHAGAKEFIDNVAGALEMSVSEVLDLALDGPPLRPHLEDAFGLRTTTLNMLKEA